MQRRVVLVTGGLGFIGKFFVKRCLELDNYVVNVDVVNYAADRVAMRELEGYEHYRFIHQDVAELKHIPETDFVVNFAAESHVDNSIVDNHQFCRTNIFGVQQLLELVRARMSAAPNFIQISTDEVYGDIIDGVHRESDPLRPSNPYSSTKAAADMLVLGWSRTYDLSFNIIRMSNNYGPHQYPEKLIPRSIWRMSRGQPALMHGDGSYIRSWLHVHDAVDAILTILERGEPRTIYNVSGDTEISNSEVLYRLADIFEIPRERAIKSVMNRVGQDLRYSMDDSRVRALGWQPKRDFDESLEEIAQNAEPDRFI